VSNGTPLTANSYWFSNDGNIASYWLEVQDGGFIKGVLVTLTQSGADITAKATSAKYSSGSTLGFNFGTSGTAAPLASSQAASGYGGHTTTLKIGNDSLGTIVLSGVNTYTGLTNVARGTLRAGVASVAGVGGAFGRDSAVNIANVAETGIDLNGFSTRVGSLAGGGPSGGNLALRSATLTTGGDNSNPGAYAGVISGTGGITKIGSGTQILTGSNSYTGWTTVEEGALAGTGAAGSNFIVKAGATLSPGATVGTMITKSLTFESGSTIRVEINSTTGTADTVVAHGPVYLTGVFASFVETGAGAVPLGTKLVILDYTGQSLSGTFAGLPQGSPVTVGQNTFTVAYADNSRVTLTSAPGFNFTTWAAENAPGETIDMDHDHDGVPNGIEYFMGVAGSSFTAPPPIVANGHLSWPKDPTYSGVYGTDYSVQTSTDLDAWSDVLRGEVLVDSTSIDYTLAIDGFTKFARLKVTGP